MKPILPSVIIGVCVIICFAIAASAYRYRSKTMETIEVTGLAEKDFNSNLIVWSGSYSRKSMDLKTAYEALKTDENIIRKYLNDKGVNNALMVFSSVSINKEYDRQTDALGRTTSEKFNGFNLTQAVTLQSNEVDKIDKISREATELIENGIELNSSAPQFYNTKLNELKMELLAQASADAKTRAKIIAKNAGNSLGRLKKATMGVFQITGKNSNENFSYGGTFNTTSRYKTGSITMKMEFAVE